MRDKDQEKIANEKLGLCLIKIKAKKNKIRKNNLKENTKRNKERKKL